MHTLACSELNSQGMEETVCICLSMAPMPVPKLETVKSLLFC